MTKFIFVTGGVVSSLGKGLTSASIGMLIESRGLKIAMQKIDPYINVDAGTMNPYQHGEVYVTEDGAETDLDLGHYERFTNCPITKNSNITTGKIYDAVIQKERKGEYLGKTVQVVPHITDEIKIAIKKVVSDSVDIVISEIGGTVGDIESLPFLEAIRQMRMEYGTQNTLFIHLTLLPYLKTTQEVKTKPTQHSVGRLREIGIIPDILICRCEKNVDEETKKKISLFCNVEYESVFEEKDITLSIYELPIVFLEQGLDDLILRKLNLKAKEPDVEKWKKMLKIIKNPRHSVDIAVVGKYIELNDSYKSIFEALTHGGIENNTNVVFRKINSEELEKGLCEKLLGGVDGILVPGGFGMRGIEGKINAVKFARENKIPFFGICLGMQCAAIEFTRNVCNLKNANSTEFQKNTPHPVISLLEEQKSVKNLGGSMRLGVYPCIISKNTKTFDAYKTEFVQERHRHRYEFNLHYKEIFEKNGMIVSGVSPDNRYVEAIEYTAHPWFVATQFHPEFKSKPLKPHPLFSAFIKSALEYKSNSNISSNKSINKITTK